MRVTGQLRPSKVGGIYFYRNRDIESLLEGIKMDFRIRFICKLEINCQFIFFVNLGITNWLVWPTLLWLIRFQYNISI